jgi:hypothetical protein
LLGSFGRAHLAGFSPFGFAQGFASSVALRSAWRRKRSGLICAVRQLPYKQTMTLRAFPYEAMKEKGGVLIAL